VLLAAKQEYISRHPDERRIEMAKNKARKRSVKVGDLPETERELTAEEQKKVKGGAVVNHEEQFSSHSGGVNIAMADGSVRKTDITDGTSNTLLPAVQKR
jgi:prepilin-type processing-associated H-X9-DG protein